jgi:hypothetical protein
MNIDFEFNVKIRATDEKPVEKHCLIPFLARLLDKLAAHPCVLMMLREFTKR